MVANKKLIHCLPPTASAVVFASGLFLFVIATLRGVDAHGYMTSPRARNYVAMKAYNEPECNDGDPNGCPPTEYCESCLNANAGICGMKGIGGRSYETPFWVDEVGNPMPWAAQAVYDEGSEVIIKSYIRHHHNGHMELRACNKGPNDCNQSDLVGPLEFIEDVSDQLINANQPTMPKDPFNPERGMYAGGQNGDLKEFAFRYKLPEGFYGERVMLQWKYITANSCEPPGYKAYFEANPSLPLSYWSQNLPLCTVPFNNDGSRDSTHPEQFFNCAEIEIRPAQPTKSPMPTDSPTKRPTLNPTVTSYPSDAPTTLSPTMTKAPIPSPTPGNGPTAPTIGCCSINLKDCHHTGWCAESEYNCVVGCKKFWLPTGPRQGCSAMWTPCTQGNDEECCGEAYCNPTDDHCFAPYPGSPTPPLGTSEPSETPIPTSAPVTPEPTTTSNPTEMPTTLSPTITHMPTPSTVPIPSTQSQFVRVNQIGYLRSATKIGVVITTATSPLAFQIQNAAFGVILEGSTHVYGPDDASNDHVHQADFSSLTELGTYKLVVENVGSSLEFAIAPSLYPSLPLEAMNYFYFHRMGDEVLGQHLIDDRYARAALHPGDSSIPAYNDWCGGCNNFDLFGSWADAGDFGIYSVNHAISAWTLLNLLEKFPNAFGDGELNIPESGNSIPDILDEVNYGSRFLGGMLPSNGGLASHKAHNHQWSPFTITIEDENSISDRSAMGPSTAATYAVARVNAQLARMFHALGNTAHASDLWDVAEDAWSRADGTSKIYSTENSPGPAIGGGDYPDGQISDDEYAAAVEMYLTAYALQEVNVTTYKSKMQASSHYKGMGQWDWASVMGAGTLSLYAVANDLSLSDKQDIEVNIVDFANSIIDTLNLEGYPSNIKGGSETPYPWGSNSFIMNRIIALAYAYEITYDTSYLVYMMRSMDYIMGVNAMHLSYVTGYGEIAETDTHDRWAWTIGQDAFWPKGWLSGGPNNELINDNATPNTVPAKSYAAPGTAKDAWCSKENTVNWNAPLAWVSWYIENKVVPILGGCTGNCPPQAKSMALSVQMDEPISFTLTASDYDGSVVSWSITGGPSLGTLTGTAPNYIYTPDPLITGSDAFTYTVQDDSGSTSNEAVVTFDIRDCDMIDIFNVPLLTAYPSYVERARIEYSYVHVSENGPNLGGVTKHVTQWDGMGLYEFSLAMSAEPYYKSLMDCMTTQTLSQAQPSIVLSGCSYGGIDGEYWITTTSSNNDNEIWVEKNNRWTIVFSNSEVAPEFCRTDPNPATSSPTSTGSPTSRPTEPPSKAPFDPNQNPPPTEGPTNVPTPRTTEAPSNAPVDPSPTGEPTNDPSASPVQPPAQNTGECCTTGDLQTCDSPSSGNCWESEANCSNCNHYWLVVPHVPTGCCQMGGWPTECNGLDFSTQNSYCHQLQVHCEGNCNGQWIANP